MPRVSPLEFAILPSAVTSAMTNSGKAFSQVSRSNLLNSTGFNNRTPMPVNAKFPLLLSLAIALMPMSDVLAQVRRSAPARSSGVARSAPQFRGAAFRGAAPRYGAGPRYGAAPRYNWGGSRFNNFSSVNRPAYTGTRTVINRTPTNWNRFNNTYRFGNNWNGTTRFGSNTNGTTRFGSNTNGTTRFGNNWNNTNHFNGTGFNRNGNSWHGGNWSHHHHDDNFIFFSALGFPFFWNLWYPAYYSAYYPYYGYTPYSYDPYSYGYGYPNYSVYGDGNYGYGDPGYETGQPYDNGQPNDQSGADQGSVVARVQEHLARENYYKGDIDGVTGSRTYYAIRAYQRDHHLQVTGEINDELLHEMGLR